jgi:hypothetical protein
MRSEASMRLGWKFILTLSLGWGLTWAIGYQIVYELNTIAGWVSIGAMGGLVNVLVLHNFACPVPGRLARVAGGWLAAGLCAAGVTKYEIARGWIAMGIVGGGTMAFALGRIPRSKMVVQMAVAMVGWVAAGLVGARIQATWGRELGYYIGTGIGGRATPYLIWSLAWGIGGSVAGGLGAGLVSWQSALQYPPKLPAG